MPRPRPPRPSCPRTARRTWPGRSGRVQGLVERARGTSGVLRERRRAVMAALDAAADVDVVSTLEAEAARTWPPITPAADETAADPAQADLLAEAGVLDDEEAAFRDRWREVLGDDLPEDALAKVRAREPLARAVAREQQDLTALDARLAGLGQRHAAAAVKADLLDNESVALEVTTARLEAEVAACRVALDGASGRAEAAERTADGSDQARHRSAARAEALERALRDLQGPAVVSSCAGWTAWWGRCSTSSRSTKAGRPPSRRPPARAWRRWWSTGASRPIRPWPRCRERGVTGAVLAPRRDGAGSGGANGANGTAFAPSAALDLPQGSGAQSVRRHVRARHGEAVAESVLDALIGHAVRVDGWEEAIDLSLERGDLIVVTPEGDRFAATGWRVRSSTNVVTAAAVEDAQHAPRPRRPRRHAARLELARCRTALSEARDALARAERALDRHLSARATAASDTQRTTEERRRLDEELARPGRPGSRLGTG